MGARPGRTCSLVRTVGFVLIAAVVHRSSGSSSIQILKNFIVTNDGGGIQKSKLHGMATTVDGFIQLENVALSSKEIHIYAPSDDMRRALQILNTSESFALQHYQRYVDRGHQVLDDLPAPKSVIHEDIMIPERDCPRGYRDEIAFFYSPWLTNNNFHLHNDNLLPLVNNIRHAPWCDDKTLQCSFPTRLYQLRGDPELLRNEAMLARVRDYLFDNVTDASEIFDWVDSTCFRALVWGRGRKVFYQNSAGSYFEELARNMYDKVQKGLDLRVGRRRKEPGTFVKAVHIKRSPPRYIVDLAPLMKACNDAGLICEECCNWETDTIADVLNQVGDADIIMGRHGAGLAHVLYAAPDASVIDFGAPDRLREIFSRMVRAAGNGRYVRVMDTQSWRRQAVANVTEERAARVFKALLNSSDVGKQTSDGKTWWYMY